MDLLLVIWSCAAIFGLVVLIAFQLVVVRLLLAARLRRQRDLERRWLPLLLRGLEETPERLPALDARDVVPFVILWNRLHDSLKGFNVSLQRMALLTGVDEAARRMFRSAHVRERLLAITTLGRLRDVAMWDRLEPLARGQDLIVSLTAARAMVRIDPEKAIPLLLPIIVEREDWPSATVAAMLEDAGAAVISDPLAEAILAAPPSRAHRLIRFLGLAHPETAVPLLRLLIRRVESVDSITACLRAFSDGTDLEAIHPFLQHPRWEVRVRAVEAFGRLGTAREQGRLVAMLSDAEWWVRYRGAQALCSLLSTDLGRVRQLSDTLADPFARDILAHVLAELGAA